MGTLASIKTDPNLETEGVWTPYPDTDIEFKIARLKNPEAEPALRKAFEKLRGDKSRKGQRKLQNMTEWDQLQTMAPVVARHIVKDWKNLEIEEGVEHPYNYENCLALLRDPQLRDVYDFIIEVASDGDEFRAELMEEAEGN